MNKRAVKKTGSDQTQPTVRITVECLDRFEECFLVATGTPRGSGPPTGVTYEWWSDFGPGLLASIGAGSDERPPDDVDPLLESLLRAGQEMLKAVASGNVFTPAPAPRPS